MIQSITRRSTDKPLKCNKFNAADKILEVSMPTGMIAGKDKVFDGQTLYARMSVEPEFIDMPKQQALQSMVQDVQAVNTPKQSQERVQEQAVPSDERGEYQPSIALSRVHQTQHDRVLELMAEKPEFNAYSAEQRSAMAMSLVADAIKFNAADKIVEVAMPTGTIEGKDKVFDGQTLYARLSVEPSVLDIPKSEALQTTQQDVVVAQQNQQMVVTREKSHQFVV